MTNEEFIKSVALPGEEWRDVVDYEGIYAVSSFGRIASLRDSFTLKRHGKECSQAITPHICSTSISPSTKYRRVSFMHKCKKRTMLVHRVVAMAFIPNPMGYSCIDHIDDNPENNHASNLQWCTYKMNNSKPHHKKATSMAKKGRIDPKRKPLVALKDGEPARFFSSMHEASNMGFYNSAILRVLRGELKTHHGYQWMYLSDYESQVSMSKNSSITLA